MKKILAFSFVVTLFLSTSFFGGLSANAAYSDPLPNSSCVDGVLKVYINPQGVSGNTAVRIDNRSNGWNPNAPLAGDVINNAFKGSAYVNESAEIGVWYSWWIHTVDANGVYGPAKGGDVYCQVHSPINTENVYEYPYLTLSWKPVKGAVRYAIRVDDTERSPASYNPTPFDAEKGDRIDEVTETSYRFKVGRDRKFSWWVHAIDKNGQYSAASRVLTIRTQ